LRGAIDNGLFAERAIAGGKEGVLLRRYGAFTIVAMKRPPCPLPPLLFLVFHCRQLESKTVTLGAVEAHLECGALPPLLFLVFRLSLLEARNKAAGKAHFECGASPPLFLRFSLLKPRNKSGGKR
jgi:hypothetical protein